MRFETLRRSVRPAAVAAAAVLGCTSNNKPPAERPAAAPTQGIIAGIALNAQNAQPAPKVIVASFEFTPGGVNARGAIATFGDARRQIDQGADFRVELVDNVDRVLSAYAIRNPRLVVVEKEGLREMPRALYSARFPFQPTAQASRVLDKQGGVLARQDVSAAVKAFCAPLLQDRDCASATRK